MTGVSFRSVRQDGTVDWSAVRNLDVWKFESTITLQVTVWLERINSLFPLSRVWLNHSILELTTGCYCEWLWLLVLYVPVTYRMCRYVYKRLKWLGNKSISQAITLIFLTVWHGLWPGYLLNFSFEYFAVRAEKEVINNTCSTLLILLRLSASNCVPPVFPQTMIVCISGEPLSDSLSGVLSALVSCVW